MFLEPNHAKSSQNTNPSGWVEVICGSMFSGKTEELIRRLKRAKIAQLQVEIFKPAADTRYHDEDIVSHNQNSIRSTPVHSSSEILLLAGSCDVVGLDEAQFFDENIIEVCNTLANQGKRVIIAGLDMDFKGLPFGPMPGLMSIAEYITKVHAVCVKCGGVAQYSHRIVQQQQTVMLGESESYEALCRTCFTHRR
ncbi:thymidine kinase [Aquirufa ecclesiirivi]|uniref:Thymidine kinase n=1 Tax=Aquirufa ecclesiirivi TaxID=2715124 RepID=A0ABT4JIB7_9BACT|nr:thymidine kinase [Aquirufa ecclesiirivi]MCZ2471295.1 thymidine kinase [Aquirufa ecclesiirivi]MCZ2476000.1 thymidine kinase [Aquirufa ecclesiirivi]